MKILVCGGRDYNDYEYVKGILSGYRNRVTHIIHGAARGADSLAGRWAQENGVQEVICPANWDRHGKAAGHIRNSAMADLNPDLVVAFPGGKGTGMMMDIASKRQILVIEL